MKQNFKKIQTPKELRLFQGIEIRTLRKMEDDSIWFVAIDIANVLEIKNTTDFLKNLKENERARLNLGRQGDGNIVSESGFYKLVLRSRKPQAEPFQDWVSSEVLPAIRKNGFYISETISPLQIGEMITEVKSIYEERKLFDLEYRDLREKIEETLENFGATAQQVNGIFATMFQNLHIANVRKTAGQIVFDELKEQRREISIQSFNQLRKISKIYKKDFLVALNYLDENEIVRFRNYLRHVINETIFYMNSPFTTVTLQGIQRQIAHSSANLALNMLDYGAKNFPRPLRAEIEKLYTLLTEGGSEKEIEEILETIKITHHNLEESLKK
jgi:prophage antirepressor-like protein